MKYILQLLNFVSVTVTAARTSVFFCSEIIFFLVQVLPEEWKETQFELTLTEQGTGLGSTTKHMLSICLAKHILGCGTQPWCYLDLSSRSGLAVPLNASESYSYVGPAASGPAGGRPGPLIKGPSLVSCRHFCR